MNEVITMADLLGEKLNPKETIQKLIRQEGFCNIAKTLGDVAANEETLIRNRNDSNLRNAFEYFLYTLMDCYKGAGKKNQKWIKNLMEVDSVKYSLELCNWESSNHCDKMKEVCKTIKEWRNVQSS